jgi:transposase InsO family protein
MPCPEVSVAHRNARLTPHGRLLLVTRVLEQQRPVAHVVAELGVSRATGYKWLDRYRSEGVAGLADRSSRAHRCPHRTSLEAETAVVELRQQRKLGPARIAPLVGVPASTVHAVLVRRELSRLAWMDRPTGQVVRRYERDRPGELVHVDVKKLGRLRDGGGWRVHGRDSDQDRAKRRSPRIGFDYVHAAIDDHTRLAYAEIHPDEKADTCAGFLRRAATALSELGVEHVERVMTDNALAYRNSRAWRHALDDVGARACFTRRYRPQTNGKAERFNRTLLEEWAYQRPFTSNEERAAALPEWLHTYNHHRTHTALGGHPPITRVNNAAGHYT